MRTLNYINFSARNLKRQKLRTFLTVLAIMIGSLSIVLLVALSEGIKKTVNLQLESIGALTTINIPNPLFAEFQGGNGANYKLDQALVDKLATKEHVSAVSPTYLLANFKYFTVEGNNKNIHSSLLTVRTNEAGEKGLQAGKPFKANEKESVIIGGSYLERLSNTAKAGDMIGKRITLTMSSLDTGEDVTKIATISGVTKSGPDDAQIYITEAWAKDLVGEQRLANTGYDRISLKVDSAENVAAVTSSLKEDKIFAIGSKEMLDQFFSIFGIISMILGVIGAISLLVASIGIINTMIMATYERTREIGVLRALGASKKDIKILFTVESGIIGLFGGIAGLTLAVVLGKVGNYALSSMLEQQNLASGEIIIFPLWLILGTLVFTTLIGMFAGIYPAVRAAKLKPVDALRYE